MFNGNFKTNGVNFIVYRHGKGVASAGLSTGTDFRCVCACRRIFSRGTREFMS